MRRTLDDFMFIQVVEPGLTALSDATYYPASASFIDVSGYERFAFLVGLDTVVNPDFAIYQDISATATASIKAVTGAAKTDIVTADDDKWFTIEVEVDELDGANGFRYVTLKTANITGGSDNACIIFLAWGARHEPVTQPAGYYAAVDVSG